MIVESVGADGVTGTIPLPELPQLARQSINVTIECEHVVHVGRAAWAPKLGAPSTKPILKA